MSLLSRISHRGSVLRRATPKSGVFHMLSTLPSTNNTLSLPEERNLGYALYGAPTGRPVFYFHGSPSCRLEAGDWHKTALNQGIRVIGVDRWGMGLSSFRPKARITDWPADVQALADHLKISRYHVVGCSGGGPYALACAAQLPKTVLLGTGIVAGVAPPEAGTEGVSWDRWLSFKLNTWLPIAVLKWMMDAAFGKVARGGDDAAFEKQLDKVVGTFNDADGDLLRSNPQMKKDFGDCCREACRQGCDGAVWDAKLVFAPWGFDLKDISAKVGIWNGTADTSVPVQSAKWMAERLIDARLRVYEGESHMGLPINHGDEILAELVEME